jgi:hypothetical protein
MATDDSQTAQYTRTVDLETALTDLLHTATAQGEDPQGTYTVPATDGRPAYTVEITEIPAAERQSRREQHSYCLHCNWSVSTDEYSRAEMNTQLVQHAIETGHDIESLQREHGENRAATRWREPDTR